MTLYSSPCFLQFPIFDLLAASGLRMPSCFIFDGLLRSFEEKGSQLTCYSGVLNDEILLEYVKVINALMNYQVFGVGTVQEFLWSPRFRKRAYSTAIYSPNLLMDAVFP